MNEVDLTLGSLPDFFWYIDDDNEGMRVEYPSDRKVSDTNLGRGDAIRFFLLEENTELGAATAAVVVKIAPRRGISLGEAAAQQIEGSPNTRAHDIKGTELSGLQAYKTIFYEYGAI